MRPEKNSWTEHKWQYNSWQDAVTTDFHYQEHRVKGLLYWLAQGGLVHVHVEACKEKIPRKFLQVPSECWYLDSSRQWFKLASFQTESPQSSGI